jgi:hypothetical protein
VSELWYPERYCERYGEQWCTDPYDGPPHYPTGPITVIDASAVLLGPARADFWRDARKVALDDWRVAGREFKVVGDPSRAYEPGCITLILAPTPDGTAGYGGYGMTPDDAVRWPDAPHEAPLPGVGWAQVDVGEFEKIFKSKVVGSLRAIIGHEIGHAFGFGHAPARACMDTDTVHNTHPTPEEISALGYWWNHGG